MSADSPSPPQKQTSPIRRPKAKNLTQGSRSEGVRSHASTLALQSGESILEFDHRGGHSSSMLIQVRIRAPGTMCHSDLQCSPYDLHAFSLALTAIHEGRLDAADLSIQNETPGQFSVKSRNKGAGGYALSLRSNQRDSRLSLCMTDWVLSPSELEALDSWARERCQVYM